MKLLGRGLATARNDACFPKKEVINLENIFIPSSSQSVLGCVSLRLGQKESDDSLLVFLCLYKNQLMINGLAKKSAYKKEN